MPRKGGSALMNLEVEIDRLLMRVVQVGTLPEVEDALRKARRHLYAAWSSSPEPTFSDGPRPDECRAAGVSPRRDASGARTSIRPRAEPTARARRR